MEGSSDDPTSRVESFGVKNGGPAFRDVSSGNAPVTAGEASQVEGTEGTEEGDKGHPTVRDLCAGSEPYDPATDFYYDNRLVGTRYNGKVPVGYAFVLVHHKTTKIYELIGDISAAGKSDVVKCGGLCCAKSTPRPHRPVSLSDAMGRVARQDSGSEGSQ